MPLPAALALLHQGDLESAHAVGRALPALARLAERGARALAGGGRVVYAGAGSSGRLAALDAAECPPTFGVAPGRVVALVAGGTRALRRAVEGAEDDVEAGREAARKARLGPRDLVVGVTASGTTPFVLAVLGEARRLGASTALVTSNPGARPRGALRAVLDTGPELVAGSTRLKAGSATKMALSLFTTGAMLRLGRVREGRMIDLAPTSDKLRRRAVRMVMELAGVGSRRARSALVARRWRVREALQELAARPGARGAARAGRWGSAGGGR